MELHRTGKLIGIQKYRMGWAHSPNISQSVHLPCDHKAQSSNQEEDSLHKNLKIRDIFQILLNLSSHKMNFMRDKVLNLDNQTFQTYQVQLPCIVERLLTLLNTLDTSLILCYHSSFPNCVFPKNSDSI